MRELVGCNVLYYGYDTDVNGKKIQKIDNDFDLFVSHLYRDGYYGVAVEAFCFDVDKNKKYKVTFQDFPSTMCNTTSGRMKCLYKSEQIDKFPDEFSMSPYPGELNPRLTVTRKRDEPDKIDIRLNGDLVCYINFEDSSHIYGKVNFIANELFYHMQPCVIRYDGITREKIPFLPQELFFTKPTDTMYNFEHRDEIIKELADKGIDYHDHPELVAPDDIYKRQVQICMDREQREMIREQDEALMRSWNENEEIFEDEPQEKPRREHKLLNTFLDWLTPEPHLHPDTPDFNTSDSNIYPPIDNNFLDHVIDNFQEAQEDLLSDGIYGNGR